MKQQEFEITDDAGFLGLVNANLYRSFIDEDWEFDQLKERIIQESNKGHLLFWGTEVPNTWTVRVCSTPVADKEIKSFEGKINVTKSKLYLLNYETISIAAQFDDKHLSEDDLKDYCIPLENGVYSVTIRQLLDPEEDDIREEALGFELVLQKISNSPADAVNKLGSLVWSDY